MKWKLIHLNKELVMEATRNVERIQYFRKYYEQSKVWPVGQSLYNIRSKIARMVRLYTLSLHHLDTYKHNQHIRHLSEIQQISMDIYAETEILEEWQHDQIKRQEEKEEFRLAQSEQIKGPHPGFDNKTKGLLRSVRKQTKVKLPTNKQTFTSKRGFKPNANPLYFYDGGFESDIN
nr:uncharacterized protein LOC117995256 [Maniola hyperantus]